MNMIPIFLLCNSLVGVALAVLLAAQKGRRRSVWAILGLLLGVLAPLVLSLSPTPADAGSDTGTAAAPARSGSAGGIAARAARAYRVARWEEIGQVPGRVWGTVIALTGNVMLSSGIAALIIDANVSPETRFTACLLQAFFLPAALLLVLPVAVALPFGTAALVVFGVAGFALFRGIVHESRWWLVVGHVLLPAGYLLGAAFAGQVSRLQ